jgi:hypothetical protein
MQAVCDFVVDASALMAYKLGHQQGRQEMQTTYDLTAGSKKGTFQLFLAPTSIALGVREAGIQLKIDAARSGPDGARYTITQSAARRLVEKFGRKVTYYGEPIA